jgi:hypothetical protein
MRQIVCLFVFIPALSLQAKQYWDSSVTMESKSSVNESFRNFRGKSKTTNINISFYNAVESWKENEWGITYTYLIPDYSDYVLRDRFGTYYKFEDSVKAEPYSTINGSFLYGWLRTLSLGFNAGSSLQTDIFRSSNFSTFLKMDLFKSTSILTFTYQYRYNEFPENYYSDPIDFQIKAYPNQVTSNQYIFDWQQVISERVKTVVNYLYEQDNELRPSRWDLKLASALAVSNSVFAKLSYVYGKENTNEELKNDVGYLSHQTYGVELTFEPVFEMLVSLSYDLDVEIEDNPKTSTKTQNAFDQFGLSLFYTIDHIAPYFKTSYAKSNKDDENWTVSGGFQWIL